MWTVHHDCDRWHQLARTLRNRFKSALAFGMFYHLEPHLYPRVPTCDLPILARRLDQTAPDLARQQVYWARARLEERSGSGVASRGRSAAG